MSDNAEDKQGWWRRLGVGLKRTSASIGDAIGDLVVKRKLDQAMLDEIEEALIRADLGIDCAARIAAAVGEGRYDKSITSDEVKGVLAREVEKVLTPVAKPLAIENAKPFVVLVVGVNGSGKTTTIGKLAAQARAQGHAVMLVAGDTFRAAAIDQLKIRGTRSGASVIARAPGADAAGLAFDALTKARGEEIDLLLVDTAGRLQNKAVLMDELEKMVRVMKKVDPAAPHAVLLVLDATVGQNALAQVEVFRDVAGVTGLAMTKLDGTARGGILLPSPRNTACPCISSVLARVSTTLHRSRPRNLRALLRGSKSHECEKSSAQSDPQACARHRTAVAVLRRKCEAGAVSAGGRPAAAGGCCGGRARRHFRGHRRVHDHHRDCARHLLRAYPAPADHAAHYRRDRLVFGSLTLVLHDELFIKLKPTIIYVLFGSVLLGGLAFGKPLLGTVFDFVYHLSEEGWRKLTLRWAGFFFALAVLNEIVWRTQTTDFWVSFKVFGVLPADVLVRRGAVSADVEIRRAGAGPEGAFAIA